MNHEVHFVTFIAYNIERANRITQPGTGHVVVSLLSLKAFQDNANTTNATVTKDDTHSLSSMRGSSHESERGARLSLQLSTLG
jgi:hypothetical protein